MAAKKESVTFASLMSDIKAKRFKNVYILYGNETYFIDKLEQAIVNSALRPEEQDFNLNMMYGMDVPDVRAVIGMCKEFPLMADYQVVVIREAQNVGKTANRSNKAELNQLVHTVEHIQPKTILVVCYKNAEGGFAGTEFLNAAKKSEHCVVFRSDKLREGRPMENAASQYIKSLGCTIDDKALSMLTSNVGNDISRLYTEIDKLHILVGADKRITPDLIEKNIGISKDYNNFELEDALMRRNTTKAFEILNYYEKNPKANPVVVTVSMLFSAFSKLLIINTARDRSPEGLMKAIGTKSTFRVNKLKEASRNYNADHCIRIISLIRQCDTRSKGIKSRQDSMALLRELIYTILKVR